MMWAGGYYFSIHIIKDLAINIQNRRSSIQDFSGSAVRDNSAVLNPLSVSRILIFTGMYPVGLRYNLVQPL